MNFKVKLPKRVQDVIDAYREDNNWLAHFLDECCELDASYSEKSGELYQQYRAYCIQNGEYIRSTTDFYSAVLNAGYAGEMANADCSFLVRVDIHDLNIRKGAGTNTGKTGRYTGVGIFTVVEVRQGRGSEKGWGKLKSEAGWISLDCCKKI